MSSDARNRIAHSPPAPTAIVGIACTYPGARNKEQFWNNIVAGVDAVRDVSPNRWDPEVFYDPDPNVKDKIYCKKGGWIGDSFVFNPLRHGVMPSALKGTEPDHLLVLRTVYEALEDADLLAEGKLDGQRVNVIVGKGNYQGPGATALMYRGIVTEIVIKAIQDLHPEFDAAHLDEVRTALRRDLPPFNGEVAGGLIPNICTGRVANRMDFMGRNFTIDAACASSLIATEIAMEDLASGKADLVLAGGVHIFAHVPFLQVFDAMQAMSLTSTIRPFDENCDGTMSGEGVGILALKRLDDAERDGDRIYAVIRGAGSSSDGRAKGVTAPRVEGEELALRRAYEGAGIDPRSVDLIEGHGTGTAVGDAAESGALRTVFGPTDRGRPYCAVGSVKSMIGHAMPAAGAAGLIKAALAIYYKTLPPTLHCETPRADLSKADSSFYVNSETRPWVRPAQEGPRRAGVSAFGFGGVNAHIILEEHTSAASQTPPTMQREWSTELVTLSAATREGLVDEIERVRRYALEAPYTPLRNLAFTLNCTVPREEWRLAVVAGSMDDLAAKLERARSRISDPSTETFKDIQGIYFFSIPDIRNGKVAVLFPGEGSQYLNMLSDLCLHFPVVREAFERADGARQDHARKPTSAVVFPPPAFSERQREVQEAELYSIDRATESVLTGGGALYRLLEQLGMRADMMSGHSAGEWVAMAASGVLDIDQFIDNLSTLGRLYDGLAERQDIPKKTMLAVGAGRAKVEQLVGSIQKTVEIANDNCPHQVVVVVDPADEGAVTEQLRSFGVFVERLPYDRGYHTSAFTYIREPLLDFFGSLDVRAPQTALYCSTTAAPYAGGREAILEQVTETFSRPLLFQQTIERMYEDGARVFVESGPRGNLTAFIDDILRGKPHVAVAIDQPRRDGIASLNNALGLLFAAGVDLDFAPLYERRLAEKITFDPEADRPYDPDMALGCVEVSTCYPHLAALQPVKRGAAMIAAATVTGTQPSAPAPKTNGVAAPAPEFAPPAISAPLAVSAAGPSPSARAAMDSHLQLMEQFLETQATIMEAALGFTAIERAQAPVITHQTRRAESVEPRSSVVDPPVPPAAPRVNGSAAATVAEPTKPNGAVHPAAVRPANGSVQEAPAERSIPTILLEVVSERTGYPEEMLDLDLDMEADLGIDSIKRVEILGALQEAVGESAAADVDMEVVARLKTLREVIAHLEGGGPAAATPVKSKPVAELAAAAIEAPADAMTRNALVLDQSDLDAITLRCSVSADEHLYLHDHCLYFSASEWGNELPAILSMPQTGNLELMAEAAARLEPGRKVVGAENVRSLRWVNFEADGTPVSVLLKARRLDTGRVKVSLSREDTPLDILSEAVILLADGYPQPPEPISIVLDSPRRPEKAGENPYQEHRLFHGPRFQGVTNLHTIGRNGVDAKLKVLPRNGLLRHDPSPRMWTDPFLLDAGGQLVGYWPNEYVDEGFVVLPVGLSRLTMYRPNMEPGTELDCRVRVKSLTDRQLVADFDIVDANGELVIRVEGWTDWRFYWSPRIYEFWRFSQRAYNGEPLEDPTKSGVALRRIEDLDETERQGLWHDMWMRVVLDPGEYATYQRVEDEETRTEWAFRRAAQKDAIRSWVADNFTRNLHPCDVTVNEGGFDCARAVAPWFEEQGKPAPFVATAYRDRVSVGAAAAYPVALAMARTEEEAEEPIARRAALALWGGTGDAAGMDVTPPAGKDAPWTVRANGFCASVAIVSSGDLTIGLASERET